MVSLMGDVYLLNLPFTCQLMEKYLAYLRTYVMLFVIHVSETVLLLSKNPTDNVRVFYTSSEYSWSFDLDAARWRPSSGI